MTTKRCQLELLPGGQLRIKGMRCERLDLCDGLRLEGTVRRADNVYPNIDIALGLDGRFTDHGALKAAAVMNRGPRGQFVYDDGVPGSGAYSIGQ